MTSTERDNYCAEIRDKIPEVVLNRFAELLTPMPDLTRDSLLEGIHKCIINNGGFSFTVREKNEYNNIREVIDLLDGWAFISVLRQIGEEYRWVGYSLNKEEIIRSNVD